jgi:hypothetical protein
LQIARLLQLVATPDVLANTEGIIPVKENIPKSTKAAIETAVDARIIGKRASWMIKAIRYFRGAEDFYEKLIFQKISRFLETTGGKRISKITAGSKIIKRPSKEFLNSLECPTRRAPVPLHLPSS